MGFLGFGKGSDKAAGPKDYLREAENGLRDAGRYLNPKKPDLSASITAYILSKSSLVLAQSDPDPKDKERYEQVKTKLEEIGRRIVEATPTIVVRRMAEAQKSIESGDTTRSYERSRRNSGSTLDPSVQKILDEMDAMNPENAKKFRQEEEDRKAKMRNTPYTNAGYVSASQYISEAENDLKAADGIAEELGDRGLRMGLEAVKDTVGRMKESLESREKRTEEEL